MYCSYYFFFLGHVSWCNWHLCQARHRWENLRMCALVDPSFYLACLRTSLLPNGHSGAAKEGVVGFFRGLGRGTASILTKPTLGVFDLAKCTMEGIRRSYSNSLLKCHISNAYYFTWHAKIDLIKKAVLIPMHMGWMKVDSELRDLIYFNYQKF